MNKTKTQERFEKEMNEYGYGSMSVSTCLNLLKEQEEELNKYYRLSHQALMRKALADQKKKFEEVLRKISSVTYGNYYTSQKAKNEFIREIIEEALNTQSPQNHTFSPTIEKSIEKSLENVGISKGSSVNESCGKAVSLQKAENDVNQKKDKTPSSFETSIVSPKDAICQEDRGSLICECGHIKRNHGAIDINGTGEENNYYGNIYCADCSKCKIFKAQAGGGK